MKAIICICLLLGAGVAQGWDGERSEEFSYGISMVHLIAHPERFDGRTVILQGYLKVRGSHSALFISHRDLEDGLTFNSVGIKNDGNEEFLSARNDGQAVLIEAVFAADPIPPGLDYPMSGQLVTLVSLSPMQSASTR